MKNREKLLKEERKHIECDWCIVCDHISNLTQVPLLYLAGVANAHHKA